MSLSQVLAILRARWRAALGLFLLSLGAASTFVALRPAIYQADVPVLIEIQAADVGGGWAPALVASHLATQIEIASGPAVARRALQALQGPGTPAVDQRLTVGQVMAGLHVRPGRDSQVVQLRWQGPEAAQAARVVNALVRAFVEVSLELKTAPARQDAGWVAQQLAHARQALEAAQLRLADGQRRAGVVGPQAQDHELTRLHQLATQMAQAQADTTEAQARRGAAPETSADVMDSPLLTGLKADLARLEARRQEAAAALGPHHPQMERLEAEHAAVRARLAAETTQVLRAVDTRWQTQQLRQRELARALEVQRQRVLALHQDRARIALLEQEVEAARRQFEWLSAQAARTVQQSRLVQSGLLPLVEAAIPDRPLGPTYQQTLGVGAIAGLVLAVAGVLMLELAQRRVRSAQDIVQVTGLPVLAQVPRASRAGPPPSPPRLGRDRGAAG